MFWEVLLTISPDVEVLRRCVASVFRLAPHDVTVAPQSAVPALEAQARILVLTAALEGDLCLAVNMTVDSGLAMGEQEWRQRLMEMARSLESTVYVSNDPDGDPYRVEAFEGDGRSHIVELDAQREAKLDRPVYYFLRPAPNG